MSVSRANRLVCNRGGAPGMELHSQQRLRGRRPPGGAPAWPDPVLNPRPRGRGRKSLASCIEKVTLSGWWRGWGGLRTPVVGRLDRSPPSPQLLEQVDGGATKAPVWPPSPLLSWVPVPSPQAPCCPLFSPHLSSNSVSLERGWGGWGFSLPGTPGPSLRSLGGQCGLLQSRPVSHGSLNQPHRE